MATSTTDGQVVLGNITDIAADFARQRRERQARRSLDPADFARLAEAGFLLSGVPASHGGLVESIPTSIRLISEMLRTLAHGDSSVALVASMHPAVTFTGGWLPFSEAPAPYAAAWTEQRRWVFDTVHAGAWWGTITSEPGSGGDLAKTKAVAHLTEQPPGYRLSGAKHFGSGSGVTSFMVTTAVADGESEPDWYFMDMRGVPWDGSAGVTLVAPWDGHGMIATQSHAMTFTDFPATRVAWPGFQEKMGRLPPGFAACLFSAVIVGIVETARATARQQLEGRQEALRPYERVEWSRFETECWLIEQAYEGIVRAIETAGGKGTLTGKTAIAELAESALGRLCKVMGGGTFSRTSPFGCWYEDVRALGFLRPPWGLAFDQLFAESWATP